MAVPVVRNVRAPPLVTVHTLVVLLVNVTGKPEDAMADSDGVVPKFFAPGLAKVIVCAAFGVTLLEAAEAGLVPALFVAVTVKVYAVPFDRPVTVIGLPELVPVKLPGLDVTM